MNINEKNLLVTKAAITKEARPYANVMRITNEYTEATNGHIAVRVSLPFQVAVEELPEKLANETGNIENAVITTTGLDKIKVPKKSLPVLQQIYIKNGDGVKFSTFDLETMQTIEAKKAEITFPNIDKILPSKQKETPVFKIAFDARLLKQLWEIIDKFKKDENYAAFTFSFYKNDGAVECKAVSKGQTLTAAIMPMATTNIID